MEVARAEPVLELQAAEDLGLPCKRKKSQACRGQGQDWSGEMDPKTRIAAARGGKCFVHFSTFKTPTAKIAVPKLNRTRIRSKRLEVLLLGAR